MNLGQAHKTRFWYLLGVFSKFFDEQPRQLNFIGEYPPHILGDPGADSGGEGKSKRAEK